MERAISGIVLAGGASKRFGGITKSNIIIDGEKIISRIINTIKDIFGEIIIVANDPTAFQEFSGYRITGDVYPDTGPIGGIHAALKASSGDAVFVFAGDMPFLDQTIIRKMIRKFLKGNHDILVPKIGPLSEPLHAIYRISVLKDLEKFMSESNDRAVRNFVDGMDTCYMHLRKSERNVLAFTNINSPSDIERSRREKNS